MVILIDLFGKQPHCWRLFSTCVMFPMNIMLLRRRFEDVVVDWWTRNDSKLLSQKNRNVGKSKFFWSLNDVRSGINTNCGGAKEQRDLRK